MQSCGLDWSELSELCKAMGFVLREEEAKMAVKLLSTHAVAGGRTREEIEFSEFKAWWLSDEKFILLQWTPEEFESCKDLSDLYYKFDKSKNGVLVRSEFAGLHKEMLARGFNVAAELEECWAEMDMDKDGKITFNEVVSTVRRRGK